MSTTSPLAANSWTQDTGCHSPDYTGGTPTSILSAGHTLLYIHIEYALQHCNLEQALFGHNGNLFALLYAIFQKLVFSFYLFRYLQVPVIDMILIPL